MMTEPEKSCHAGTEPVTGKITFRPAGASDISFAREVHHAAYKDVVTRQFGWEEEFQDRAFAACWGDGTGYQVICLDDVPCGYVQIEALPHSVRGQQLAILPEFQGQGIGTAVVTRLAETATRRQVPATLQVLRENHDARRLYERRGFTVTAENETHYEMVLNP